MQITKNSEYKIFSKKSKTTPLIKYKKGVLFLEGNSTMKEPAKFYYPIISELREFRNKGEFKEIHANFKKFTTRSSNCLVEIFKLLDKVENSKIIWKYSNDEIFEAGTFIDEDCDSEFEFIPIKNKK